ncbi:RPS20 [Cordylochernes scorpioides]|uniref:RPS20 n=1 Tax=Cordylochernes scorpioides TaxID=51811 RepID=A0ABY6L9R1_9ARAC|nr:RPS20 [Cordylochernes scorpioides]
MPLKRMRITTRKAPNGEGSKTWDRFQMIIHKWVIKISEGSSEEVKKAMNITLDPRESMGPKEPYHLQCSSTEPFLLPEVEEILRYLVHVQDNYWIL